MSQAASPIEIVRVASPDSPWFAGFAALYSRLAARQSEAWDSVEALAESLETEQLHVAVRDGKVQAFVYYSFDPSVGIAALWYLGAEATGAAGVQRLLESMREDLAQQPECAGICFEVNSPQNAEGESPRRARARAQLFRRYAAVLSGNSSVAAAGRLDAAFLQPVTPGSNAAERLLDIHFIPFPAGELLPDSIPRELAVRILDVVYMAYAYSHSDATHEGTPYLDYVQALRARCMASLAEEVRLLAD